MNARSRRLCAMLLVLNMGAIAATILLGNYFGLSQSVTIPLIVVLSLFCGAVALWSHANRYTNTSHWWEDDSASGWRGY